MKNTHPEGDPDGDPDDVRALIKEEFRGDPQGTDPEEFHTVGDIFSPVMESLRDAEDERQNDPPQGPKKPGERQTDEREGQDMLGLIVDVEPLDLHGSLSCAA